MSQPPQQPNGPPPPFPGGVPTLGFPSGMPPPPAGFPNGPPPPGSVPPPAGQFPPPPGAIPFAPGVPVAAAPAAPSGTVNGIPVAKQALNTTPSRTVYVSNLNEKVKLDGESLMR